MSKTTLLYKDIAPGADKDADVTSGSAMDVSTLSLLPFGVEAANMFTNELNIWGLDGTFVMPDPSKIAFWSSEVSNGNCTFSNNPSIQISFDSNYTSLGVGLIFDTASGGYCTSINVKWYQNDTLKADVDFEPKSMYYFCNKYVASYNKIVITMKATNLPYRRARLEQIIFGIYRYFEMDEIRSASIVNEMSLSGIELPISTMSWVLDSNEDVEYMFQIKQPIEIKNDNRLIGVYYIDSSVRTSKSVYSITCNDAFGILDETTYQGGYFQNKSAMSLLQEIINGDFEIIFDGVSDKNLTGIIEKSSKRAAIQQVIFAWGVCISNDGSGKIRVFNLPEDSKDIGTGRTFTGVSVTTSALVTEVNVTAHKYTESTDGNIEINGVTYKDETTVYSVKNPDVTASDKQNIKEITIATLISNEIGMETAKRVYDYYTKRNTHNSRIVWDGEKLGDKITLPNPWGGVYAGNLQRMEITLSNTVVSSAYTV